MKTAIKTQVGFTLIELMVAIGLGILLSAGLVQVFSSSKRIADTETAMSRLQETGRFAMDTIARDIRMAGYQGCADPNDLDLIIMATAITDAGIATHGLVGFEVTGGNFAPVPPGSSDMEDLQNAGVVRDGTDVVTISYASPTSARLDSDAGKSSEFKIADNPQDLDKGDIVILSDCKSAHVLEINNMPNEKTINHSGPNNPHKISPGYVAGSAKLMRYIRRTYFVGDTGRTTSGGDAVYALYVKEFGKPEQELLEGVEHIQLLYGQQVDGGNIRYVPADNADLDFSEVVSVRVGILAQSFEQVAMQDDDRTYELPGVSVSDTSTTPHAGGKSLRKTFSTTIKLRNRRQQN